LRYLSDYLLINQHIIDPSGKREVEVLTAAEKGEGFSQAIHF
jgi:hypothetical protein